MVGKQRSNVQKIRSVTSSRAVRRFPVPVPDVIGMDEIANMADEDLLDRLRTLEEDVGRVAYVRMDTYLWDVELAYIRREQMLRRYRRELHEQYVRQMTRDFNDSEIGLPTADLDNSAFTELDR